MELIDGVFHQLSKDNALVAITADYPGLILMPQVPEIEVPVPRIGVRPHLARGIVHGESTLRVDAEKFLLFSLIQSGQDL